MSFIRNIFKRIGKNKTLNNEPDYTLSVIEKNEKETALVLSDNYLNCREPLTQKDIKVYYITDIHLSIKLDKAKCKTDEQCRRFVEQFVDRMLKDCHHGIYSRYILIGGDVSSDFDVFRMFVQTLKNALDKQNFYGKVIFTLGNHELWAFPGETLEKIIDKYKLFLAEYDMYLIQNDVICAGDSSMFEVISEKEFADKSDSELKEKFRKARVVFLGGIGFSGLNEELNAKHGVYQRIISREQEVQESNTLSGLYDRLCSLLGDKAITVFTHMPFEDWHKDEKKHPGCYISGHDHKNSYYDDGAVRRFSDNQLGYNNTKPFLKYFYIDERYDLFFDYDDGIHEITKEEYIDFCIGKKIQLNFSRKTNKIYLLKKKGYCCFIHKNASNGGLTILNGGSMKILKSKDVGYYYTNMDAQIEMIKKPLQKYYEYQKIIANGIKQIGGWGNIHGAIIDIDFYCHLYVNPNDMTVTPYFAWNMVDKYVYPSLSMLLEEKCPEVYAKYNLAFKESGVDYALARVLNNPLMNKPEEYLSTDIYAASRELTKMQKLDSGILTTWYDIEEYSSTKQISYNQNVIDWK